MDSGYAGSVVCRWTDLLLDDAGDLEAPHTVRADASVVATYVSPG